MRLASGVLSGGARGRPALRLVAVCLVAAWTGCAETEKGSGPAEWVDENLGVFGQLRSMDEKERKEGIQRFKMLGPEQGAAVALHVLGDPKVQDYRLELALACILAEWQDSRAIPFLLSSLEIQDDGAVRLASEALLMNFPDSPRVIGQLNDLLNRDSDRERLTGATLLAKIGSQQAAGFLGERIRVEVIPEVKAQLVIGVIKSKHPRRVEYLIDALPDRDPAIRELAWSALEQVPGLPRVGYAPNAPDVERAEAVGALRLWLKERSAPGPRR